MKHYKGLHFIIYYLLYRIRNRAFLVVLITVDQLLNGQIQYIQMQSTLNSTICKSNIQEIYSIEIFAFVFELKTQIVFQVL